jgi:hypothetical protein
MPVIRNPDRTKNTKCHAEDPAEQCDCDGRDDRPELPAACRPYVGEYAPRKHGEEANAADARPSAGMRFPPVAVQRLRPRARVLPTKPCPRPAPRILQDSFLSWAPLEPPSSATLTLRSRTGGTPRFFQGQNDGGNREVCRRC